MHSRCLVRILPAVLAFLSGCMQPLYAQSPDSLLFRTADGRPAFFYEDASDSNTPPNGCTVIVRSGKKYKRIYSGGIDARWFGMKADWNWKNGSDNTAALTSALTAANHNEVVFVPEGRYYIKNNIVLPLATEKKVFLRIYGDIYFEKGAGFVIEGDNQYFRSYGLIAGLNTGATTENQYRQYAGTGIYLKNVSNSDIEVNEVKDFLYGIHLSSEKQRGEPVQCKNNRIAFNAIHHNYIQIRISQSGNTSQEGNINNASSWYGGQLGRGKSFSYGKGGWYGVQITREKNCTAKRFPGGHNFYDVGFEGLEKPIMITHGVSNNFIGGRFEGPALKEGIDLDPEHAVATAFIGQFAMVEKYFIAERMGMNTIIDATPIWSGTNNQVIMGTDATNSITAGKLLAVSNRYGYTNYNVNKTHDLISRIGQFPTLEAMKYRIDGVMYAVPYKKTFIDITDSLRDTRIDLPPNIGLISVRVNAEKIFRIDSGDLVRYGEYFLVDYQSPGFPISFVRSGTDAPLIPARFFPAGGIYFCLWVDGRYKVSRIGSEYRTATQTAATQEVAEGILTHYIRVTGSKATTQLPPARLFPGRRIVLRNLSRQATVHIEGVDEHDDNLLLRGATLTVISDGRTWLVMGN